MFRCNSRKIARRPHDNGLTGLLLINLQRAENLLETDDFMQGHDYFIRAEEIYASLCRDTGKGIPEIEFRLDELYIVYQMKLDLQNAHQPQSL